MIHIFTSLANGTMSSVILFRQENRQMLALTVTLVLDSETSKTRMNLVRVQALWGKDHPFGSMFILHLAPWDPHP